MFEALLLAAIAQDVPAPERAAAPSAEFLEFLGEWSEEDAHMLDTPDQKPDTDPEEDDDTHTDP